MKGVQWIRTIGFVALLAAPRWLAAQEGVVAGTVVLSGSLRALPGVQVTVKGQAGKGAVSDAAGRFRIGGLSGSQVVLEARSVGFRPDSQTVDIGSTAVRFVMAERAVELNEIVVTGTAGGEQRRVLGTSVSAVDVADVTANTAVPSVDGLLMGRAPGVTVLPGTGQVGSGAQIRIRGISSFSLSSNPLIYVDGVRVDNQTGTGITVQAFSSGVISRLNDFDPEEIENIEILKGPAAATLYGTEAARGVINILTKKGAAGETKYGFVVKGGSNWFMNADSRIPTNYCNSFTNSSCKLSATDTTLYSVNVYDTEKARGTPLFRNGAVRNYAANASGGTPLLRFFVTGEWNDNQGVDYANERLQQGGRSNISVTPNEKVDLESTLGYVKSHTTQSCEAGCGGTMWGSLYSNPANTAAFCVGSTDPGCTWVRGFNSSPPESDRAELFWQDLNRFTGSITLRYNPRTWFTNRLSFGTDYTLEDNVDFLPYITNDTIAYFWGSNSDGFRYQQHHQVWYNTYDYTSAVNFNLRPTLTAKTAGGIQYYTKHQSWFGAEGDHFPAPGLETITAAGTKIPATSDDQKNNTLGFYLQQEFGWRDQLFLTGAARVDNNSAFGNDIKWVKYPKASLSWVVSENETIKQRLPDWVSNLRLRGAYGGTGQQPDYNTALRTLAPVAGPNSQATLTPSTFGNLNLKPERVYGTELGFESGMFSDRFGIDFTYYRDVSKDAILSRQVAPSTGFGASTQFFNAGEIDKSGVEVGLKAQLISRRAYDWQSGFNISTNSGKIKRLNGTDTTIDNGSYSQRVGYAPYSWFSYRILSATYDPAQRKAINPICDDGKGGSAPCLNAAGVVQVPKVYLGRGIPSVEGSWTNNVRFLTNFRLYVMTDFARGYRRLDNNLRIRCQIFHTCLEFVQPANTDPRQLVQMQSNGTLRDFVINNAAYTKLRDVSVSWDVPDKYSSRFRAHGVALTASGRNLHTWSPYTGLDPEMQFLSGANVGSNFGVDQAEYPPLASFVFTIRASY
jgi:TonB-linked SusC/RagA family outer membrane protein